MIKPNLNLVNDYLNKEEPALYDMKRQWIDIDDALERELHFKRKCCCVPDPDECELTMSIMCILLKGNGIKVEGYSGRHVILEDGERIETDTANSFISLYKGALMTCLPNYFDLLAEFDIKGGFLSEYEKIYAHRDLFCLKESDNELHLLFCEFASLTHSIGNIVLGPVGFNCADIKSKAKLFSAKKWSDFDRMDLFLKEVSEGKTYDSWEEWYSRYLISTYTNFFYEKIVNKNETTIDLKQSKLIDLAPDDLKKRLRTIISIIKARGNKMVDDLNTFMGDEVWN